MAKKKTKAAPKKKAAPKIKKRTIVLRFETKEETEWLDKLMLSTNKKTASGALIKAGNEYQRFKTMYGETDQALRSTKQIASQFKYKVENFKESLNELLNFEVKEIDDDDEAEDFDMDDEMEDDDEN